LYHPDFILVTKQKVYVIETKGQDKIKDENVKQKQLATLAWCSKINKVSPDNRMGKTWEYILLSENHFYSYQTNGATITEICELAKVSEANVKGMLL
jgi:type III restriction enzyme